MPKRWFRLDTAALIFPATMSGRWANVFRQSVTLDEEVDPKLLQQAVDDLKHRFPTFYVRLGRGLFWCYLEESEGTPRVTEDFAYPLTPMKPSALRDHCMRVLYYKDRLAVEFFHSLSDGGGAKVYLKALTARYLELRHGLQGPFGDIPEWDSRPEAEESEDSFYKYSSGYAAARESARTYRLSGTREAGDFRHLVTGITDTQVLLDTAHGYGCTLTVFLAAVMAKCLIEQQRERVPYGRQKPVKVTIPVDMRKLYGSRTLRNFVLTVNIGVDPRQGDYTLQELCRIMGGQLASEATRQGMAGRIAANVLPQQNRILRMAPLFIKNIAMNIVYRRTGESTGCINISNLGNMEFPGPLAEHVRRVNFIIGNQLTYPNNCSVVSYGGRTCINMIRNIRESDLERRFFSSLVELGIPVDIESNER